MALPVTALLSTGKLVVDHWDKVAFTVDKVMGMAKMGDAQAQQVELKKILADAEMAKTEAKNLFENAARLEIELNRCRASLKLQGWITLASVLAALASASVTALVLTR